MTKYLTPEGLKKLKQELDYLKNIKRKEIAGEIKYSASFGDLKENAAYDMAKEDQGFVEGRIAELGEIIGQAKTIKKKNNARIQVGSTVFIKCGKTKERFQIVEPEEVDVIKGMISYQSCLGKALLNRVKGETVDVETPGGTKEYKIIQIA